MKKLLSLLLLGSGSFYCSEDSETSSITAPNFASSINLLAPRGIAQRLEQIYPGQIPTTVLTWLASPQSYAQLENGIGRQLTQTAYDDKRREIYTGAQLKPSYIVLTASGKPTLEETVASLKAEGLAHAFIININGDIHPVTQENETVDNALSHRLYAVGISGRVVDGCCEQRDMNSASISISMVGQQNKELTNEQTNSLAQLIQYLQKQYEIRPDQLLDYGCTACFADGRYGRRAANPLLPWRQLQKLGLATYPVVNDSNNTIINFSTPEERIIWTSQALRKIGFICPITSDSNNEHFKAAIAAFTFHSANNGFSLLHQDSVIGDLNSMTIQHEKLNPKLREIQPPALPLQA